jgi:two-component system, OmpR family, sensor kinase
MTGPAVEHRPSDTADSGDGGAGGRPVVGRLISRPTADFRHGALRRHRGPIALLGLVVVVLLVVAAVSTVLVRRSLVASLDRHVRSASDRYAALMEDPSGNDHDADDDFSRMVGPATDTLGAVFANGRLSTIEVLGRGSPVPGTAVQRLASLRPAAGIRTVELPGLGSYRMVVRAAGGDRVEAVGLPLKPVHRSIGRLLMAEAALLLLFIALLAGLAAYFARRGREAGREAGREGGDRGQSAGEANLQALIAEASHELRTPAAVIHSYAELAEQSAPGLPPSVHRALQRIESESARMGRMVEDLLVLSKFEGGYRPALAEVDLTKLVLDAVDDARVAGRQDRWELAAPDEPVQVLGNGRWLFQAVAALLANARAHTPPGTTVRIALRRQGSAAELSIADDGPGIPPDLLPVVFDRFVRSGDNNRYDGLTGVGLGLSVVRQIVQAHSGTIRVGSSPAGTEFVLRLPLATTGHRPL